MGECESIDFEISMWAMANGIKTNWNPHQNSKVFFIKKYENSWRSMIGHLSVISAPFGCIFLVQGPNPTCTVGLEESSKLVEDLYYDMLKNTHPKIRKIVLCAVSTGKLAAGGTTVCTEPHNKFTKEQWIRHIYNGIPDIPH